MNISIFGLGYVGSVGLGCLAHNGHSVVGVDINRDKVDLVNQGRSPIIEKDLALIIAEQKKKGRISATTDVQLAIKNTDITFICVGTPPSPEGHLKLDGVYQVAGDIAQGIRKKLSFHIIAIRSTVPPGTNEKVASVIEAATAKKPEVDFAVVSNPEFLREGTAVSDFFNPPYTLIGTSNQQAKEMMGRVYENVDAPIFFTEIRIAEIIKYVNNSFHALKISFANEIGSICKKLNIDSHKLMDVFCKDTKLNISPSYLKPGFAYGGSCLPKDLKALCAIAHDYYIKAPVLESISISNEQRKSQVLNQIIEFRKQRIGFLGLSFKAGTDDLRESPIIDVLEKLLGKGYSIKIYDKNVSFSKLIGANREFILQRIPFISRFIYETYDEVVSDSDLIVVVNNEPGIKEILARLAVDKVIYDFVNIDFPGRSNNRNYVGAAW